MQADASISNLPSPALIAPTGQAPAQAPQDTQPSLITNAIILSSFSLFQYAMGTKCPMNLILKQVTIDSKYFF
jgi:hypothetical protein